VNQTKDLRAIRRLAKASYLKQLGAMTTHNSISLLVFVVASIGLIGVQAAYQFPLYTDARWKNFRDDIPFHIRAEHMRASLAVQLRGQGPCPFGAFGAIVVNRTSNEVICTNSGQREAPKNPALHAENAALNNCSEIFRNQYGISNIGQRPDIWNQLDMYATGEPCPMDCGALLWARFNTVVWSVSIPKLIEKGFQQMNIQCKEIAETWKEDDYPTRWIGNFLEDEITPYFSWQYDQQARCPFGCRRVPSPTTPGTTTCADDPRY
jgi:tRNA(Arg) A34 adenosine deaminase TadA